MQNDGSQFWIVICREMNKYVSELPEENGESIHYKEVTANKERPAATKQKKQFTPSLSSSSTTAMPIDLLKWNDIHAVEYVDEESLSFNVSMSMTRVLRHRGLYRETDGAMEWNRVLPMLCRHYSEAPRWTNQEWVDLLRRGTDKKRFQYCLNSDGFTHYMRAIQGHSGRSNVDPSLLDNVQIPYRWSEYLYHVGSSLDLHPIKSGLIAGGKDTKEGRAAVIFTAVNPMTEP